MKISVVIPVYNAKKSIKNAIESVLSQTYCGDIEIIVVNDGSTDGCDKIVDDLILKFDNIRLINKKNGGVSSARNIGVSAAVGEWIAFLDADDIWLPEKLEKQIAEIKKEKIDFIGCNRNQEVYPFFKKNNKRLFCLSAKDLLFKWYPHTSTALVKRSVLLQAGLYDEKRTHAEDGDLFLRVIIFCDIWILNEDLVFTGGGKRSFGDSGLSANMPKMYQGEILALKSARERHQINYLEFTFFFFWLSIKYFRRQLIVRFS